MVHVYHSHGILRFRLWFIAKEDYFIMISLEEFLRADTETVAKVMPQTVMFAAGGTRRDAVLNGVSLYDVRELAAFSMKQFYDTAQRMFKYGVRHIFALTVHSKQLYETGEYRNYVIDGTRLAIGELSYPYYEALNCRGKFVGAEDVPELMGLAEELEARTGKNDGGTVWWLATGSNDMVWERTLRAAQGATSRQEVVRNYFGEDVPPAGWFLSYGKPFFSPEIMPLVLIGEETHSYFYQRPGYILTDEELRTIAYDYAYVRKTWVPDKMARYIEVPGQQEIWAQNPILGLGRRVGSFWYPQEIRLHDSVEV
jgi:hypothetical protein